MIKLSIAYFLVPALYILIMLRITLVLTVCMVNCTTFLFHILILKLLLPLNLCILSCGVLHLLFLSMVINITFYFLIMTLDLVGFIYLSPNLKPLLNLFIQFPLQIKTFKFDGGGKFTSNEFKAYLSNHGIAHHISCPYTPQQNGVVERKHRHIIETAIALLSQPSLSYSVWTFVVQIAISLINVLPTSVLGWQSPWSTLYSTSLDMSQFKVFGYACYPNLRPYTTHELEPRTRECIFIGYPTHSKGYLCLNPHTKHV